MAKIVIETGLRKGAEYTLAEKPMFIGREPECEIVVPDRMASRKHVRVWLEGGAFWAEDAGSHNGSLLNSKPLTAKTKLNDKDELIAGTTVLRFHALGTAASPPPPLTEKEKARGHRDTVAQPSGIAATRAPPPGPPPPPKPKLAPTDDPEVTMG
ncbi:MAG: FHA domain-containing protein [Planctomycetales bacterium]|nr:FHA domain-containing protein [Planctomycetales bacterium]